MNNPELEPTTQEKTKLAEGEKNLLAAMLSRAWADLYSSNRLNRADARKWLLSNCIEPFSFLNICDLLDLESDQVRKLVINHSFQEKITKVSIYRYKKVNCAIVGLDLFFK